MLLLCHFVCGDDPRMFQSGSIHQRPIEEVQGRDMGMLGAANCLKEHNRVVL